MSTSSISRRLGCTEGQLYTMATGSVVAALLALAGAHPSADTGLAGPPPGTPSAALRTPTPPVVVVPPAGPVPAPVPSLGSSSGDKAPSELTVPTPTPSAPVVAPAGPVVFARIGSPGAPGGLAVGRNGEVFVTTDNGTAQGVSGPSKVLALGATGHQLGAVTIRGQARDHAYGLRAAAVDPKDGSVLVSDVDSSTIIRVDVAAGTQRVVARVPDVKPCALVLDVAPCEPGLVDHAPALSALVFDTAGNLYVADAGQATIWRWQAGKKAPAQWYSSTDLATGDGPAGLAFSLTGSLLFTAGTTLDASNIDAGGLYRLAIAEDGHAGARTLLAGFASGARPGAVAADPFGPVYVILRGSGSGSGSIVSWDGGVVNPFVTTGSPIPLDGPSGLAFQNGRLLVTNGTASKNASHWAVLSFPGLVA